MNATFFEKPILNSPYEYPKQHWELDESGQPTNHITPNRRKAEFITPIPKPKKQQKDLVFNEGKGLSTEQQQYELTSAFINELRVHVDRWRALPNPNQWNVTPETARLIQHWRQYPFTDIRPFFCQVEAVETAIWLTEVAPKIGKEGRRFLDHITNANADSNPLLWRVALKLATGSGKTTVMAMLIAWQTVNAVRRPNSKNFTRGFLIVTPGLTIKDRLRVLQPNDPDSYYQSRELVPGDMLLDLGKAKIIITNYHAFKLRQTLDLSKGGRALLQGRTGPDIETLETRQEPLKPARGWQMTNPSETRQSRQYSSLVLRSRQESVTCRLPQKRLKCPERCRREERERVTRKGTKRGQTGHERAGRKLDRNWTKWTRWARERLKWLMNDAGQRGHKRAKGATRKQTAHPPAHPPSRTELGHQ